MKHMVVHTFFDIKLLNASDKPLIIMFPFAGGNIYSFRNMWEDLLTNFDILCPELPGRGNLIELSPISDINILVEYIFLNYIQFLRLNKSYILYGHSMGALLSYLISIELMKRKYNQPTHLFVSGHTGPSSKKKEILHNLPYESFFIRLQELGGIPDELYKNKDFLNYIEPIIRADIKAVENYHYAPSEKLNSPISVFYGTEEEILKEDLLLWNIETNKGVEYIEMKGGHFFINNHAPSIAKYITNILFNTSDFHREVCIGNMNNG